jgi:hypothetical protein
MAGASRKTDHREDERLADLQHDAGNGPKHAEEDVRRDHLSQGGHHAA